MERTPRQRKEVWKPVLGYESYYSVSSRGRVRREAPGHHTRKGKILRPAPDTSGYPQVILHNNGGKGRAFKLHALVAAAFHGPRPLGKEINHKNGDKNDARPQNLEYTTRLQNLRHESLLRKRRERLALAIFDYRRTQGFTLQDFSRRIGISKSTISRAENGQPIAVKAEFILTRIVKGESAHAA